jgi:hypothetical protein
MQRTSSPSVSKMIRRFLSKNGNIFHDDNTNPRYGGETGVKFCVLKLKIIYNYLRTIMAQESLDRWPLVSIRKEAAPSINYNDLVTESTARTEEVTFA